MGRPAGRYLSADQRDFFYLTLRWPRCQCASCIPAASIFPLIGVRASSTGCWMRCDGAGPGVMTRVCDHPGRRWWAPNNRATESTRMRYRRSAKRRGIGAAVRYAPADMRSRRLESRAMVTCE